MGVEVHTERLWRRADEEGLARLVFVNMLDRERADFFRCLDSLKAAFGQHVVATEIPIGSEHEVRGVIDLIDMTAFEYEGEGRGNAKQVEIPEELAGAGRGVPREADGRGRRELRRADGALPRGRGDLARRDRHGAEEGRQRGPPVPGHLRRRDQATSAPTGCSRRWSRTCPRRRCAAASRRSTARTNAVEIEPDEDGDLLAYVFKTTADPYTGRINMLRVYSGVLTSDSHVLNVDQAREGAHRPARRARGQGDEADRRARARRHRRGREAARDDAPATCSPTKADRPALRRRSTCRRR